MITRITPEAEAAFRKSSYSNHDNGDCVEVADLPQGSLVRDTQNRQLGALLFGAAEWEAFTGTASKFPSALG